MSVRTFLHLIVAIGFSIGAAVAWSNDSKLSLVICAGLAGLVFQTVWDLRQIEGDFGLWEGWRARVAKKAEAWAAAHVANAQLKGDETLQLLRTALAAHLDMTNVQTVPEVMRALAGVLKKALAVDQANAARDAAQVTLTQFTTLVGKHLPAGSTAPTTLEGYGPVLTTIVQARDAALLEAETGRGTVREAEQKAREAETDRASAVDRTALYLTRLPQLLARVLAFPLPTVEEKAPPKASGIVLMRDAGAGKTTQRRRGQALPGAAPDDAELLGGFEAAIVALITLLEKLQADATANLRKLDTATLERADAIRLWEAAVAKEEVATKQVGVMTQAKLDAESSRDALLKKYQLLLSALVTLTRQLQAVADTSLAVPDGVEVTYEVATPGVEEEQQLLRLRTVVFVLQARAAHMATALSAATGELATARLLPVLTDEMAHFREEIDYVMRYLYIQICIQLALQRYAKLKKDHGALMDERREAIDTAFATTLRESCDRRAAIGHPLADQMQAALTRVFDMRAMVVTFLGFAASKDMVAAHKHALTLIDRPVFDGFTEGLPESAVLDLLGRPSA